MTDLKYPHLRKDFPEEWIDECVSAAKESPEHFKEWMLTKCHAYASELILRYHAATVQYQANLGHAFINLDLFEEMEKRRNDEEVSKDSLPVSVVSK